MKRFWYAKSKYGLWKALYVPKLLGRGIRKRGFPLFFLLFKSQEIGNACMSFLKSQLFMESSIRSICSLNYVNQSLFFWFIRGEIILFNLLFMNRKQERLVFLFFGFVGDYGCIPKANSFFMSWENPLLIWVHKREIGYVYGIKGLRLKQTWSRFHGFNYVSLFFRIF